MKTCTKCGGEPKPLTEFGKHAGHIDGLQSLCKACIKSANAKYRTANPEKYRAYDAKRYIENPRKRKDASAAYYAKNTANIKAQSAKWKKDNPATARQLSRVHAHNRRARMRVTGGILSKDLFGRLFKLQRGRCACCGVKLVTNHLDHVIPVALDGPNEDWNMQLLCPPCNLKKGAKHPIDFMQSRGFLI